MNKIDNSYNRDYYYIPRSQSEREMGYVLATLVSGAIMGTLPLYSKPFVKQMKREHLNNENYKDIFLKTLDDSGFYKKGGRLTHMEPNPHTKINMPSSIHNNDIKQGMNACYVPSTKEIRLNVNKASISGFHELGHAMNHLSSKFGKLLQKYRKTGYTIAGLMGTVALFSRKRPDEEKQGKNFLTKNCGAIAFISMLPIVLEEAMASSKGIKMAKKAGLSEPLVKNLKKFYGKALLSYFGYAVASGVAVYAAKKITEHFTAPKKVEIGDYGVEI